MTSRTTFTIGAYDRFNFGDLLFPLILDHYAADAKLPALRHVASREADLREQGGSKVEGIRALRNADSSSSLILGGGETLGARWGDALLYMMPSPYDKALILARKALPSRAYHGLGRKLLHGDWELTYLPDPAFARAHTVVANAIGASSLNVLDDREKRIALSSLSLAKLVSVRDRRGLKLLTDAGINGVLAPDSAATIRRVYPEVGKAEERVLTVQTSRKWFTSNRQQLISQIIDSAPQFDRIQLLAIGLAGGHSDQEAVAATMRALPEDLQQRTDTVTAPDVKLILEALAKSTVFVGTSLHGHIISMAYGNRSVGLQGISKLTAYIETWGEDLTPFDVPAAAVSEAISAALRSADEALEMRAANIAKISDENTRRVIQLASGGEAA